MLETDEIEVYRCFENSLIVDRYERDDVWPPSLDQYRDQLKILSTVKQDLFNVFDSCHDVQEYIKNPVKSFSEYTRPAKQLEPLGQTEN